MGILDAVLMLLAMPQAAPAPISSEQRVEQVGRLGRMLHTLDRAAWVSSDALVAKVSKEQLAGVGGYVVEPGADEVLRVTYYRGTGDAARAFFVADVRGGKVTESTMLAAPTPLTPAQATLARARDVAAKAAVERGYKPCASAPFNTVVLPLGKDGPTAVYLLTPQQDAQHYPIGGHFRVVVGRDGAVLAKRPYSVSCLSVPLAEMPKDAKPVALTVNYLLEPTPSELHVFASYSLGLPLIVVASDKTMWQVAGARITKMAPAK
ncbi:hypothetical protein [Sphingomonas sp.]|uniref:hypothetical protein n=1 Tax=Sphingomonas sp. TaxID=28214 RepID=UPI0035AF32EA